jgi:hypothetical protein
MLIKSILTAVTGTVAIASLSFIAYAAFKTAEQMNQIANLLNHM